MSLVKTVASLPVTGDEGKGEFGWAHQKRPKTHDLWEGDKDSASSGDAQARRGRPQLAESRALVWSTPRLARDAEGRVPIAAAMPMSGRAQAPLRRGGSSVREVTYGRQYLGRWTARPGLYSGCLCTLG